MNKPMNWIWRGIISVGLIVTWEFSGRTFSSVAFALSRPTLVWDAFVQLCRGSILPHFFYTGGSALCGLIIGTVVGTTLGLLTWFSQRTATVLNPFVIALGALPILAIAPMMIIWFGIGFWMKVAMASLSTVFVAFGQATKGAELVSGRYVDVLRGMNATDHQVFVKVIIPGSMDWVFSSMRINAGLALLGAFIGEFISSDKGLGHLVLKASNLYDVPRALAASLFIVFLALMFDGLGRLVDWQRNWIIRLFCIPQPEPE
jgi:NitT/TauT family transport system permease protein